MIRKLSGKENLYIKREKKDFADDSMQSREEQFAYMLETLTRMFWNWWAEEEE